MAEKSKKSLSQEHWLPRLIRLAMPKRINPDIVWPSDNSDVEPPASTDIHQLRIHETPEQRRARFRLVQPLESIEDQTEKNPVNHRDEDARSK